MLSIQEIVTKTAYQRNQIRETMDSWGQYHPDIETPEHTKANLTDGLKPADAYAVKEAIHKIPLAEFLAKSGTTGIAGAAYLVPDKVHDELIMYSMDTDIAPKISAYTVNGWQGGDLKVDIVDDSSYEAHEFLSGGQMPTQTVNTKQATLAPISFGLAPRITSDLIDDNQFGLMEFHLQRAALGIGKKATDLALTVLKTATDGWGTVNSSATGDADETKFTGGATSDVVRAMKAVGNDLFHPNTMITTQEAWNHSITTSGAAAVLNGLTTLTPHDPAFPIKIETLDICINNSKSLHLSTDAAGTFTDCVTIIFDRNNALLTGRKRWMQLNNYSDPVRDLAGATITCRQDSVTLYNDSIYVLTET